MYILLIQWTEGQAERCTLDWLAQRKDDRVRAKESTSLFLMPATYNTAVCIVSPFCVKGVVENFLRPPAHVIAMLICHSGISLGMAMAEVPFDAHIAWG